MRILISYVDRYHVYSDVMESALRGLCPRAEVAACRLGEIGEQVESFDPHLMVSSRPNTVDTGGRLAWYELSPEPSEPSETCLQGRRSRRPNPRLEELISFVGEVETLVRSGRELGGC
jgi:hypothetical protein